MVCITLLSLFSFSAGDNVGFEFPHQDKVVHFIFYFVATVLGVRCLEERSEGKQNGKNNTFRVIVFSIVFGIIIEGLQWVMPYDREGDFWDVLANAVGAITGGLLVQKYRSLNTRGN
ncbi:MAG: VanZ family protein [Bacteroidota bacterium]